MKLFGIVPIVPDCDSIVSEFKLQSRIYVHFRTNTFWKDMNLLPATPDMG